MAADFAEAWRKASEIEGWLSEGQGRALFNSARRVRAPNHIVEIGSHLGRSTILLALAANPNVRVFAIDPFDDPRWGGGPGLLGEFHLNLAAAGAKDKVDFFRGYSDEAAREWSGEPIGLIWVDGAHDASSVLADIDGWSPWLVDQGDVYFHDAYSAPGVTTALFRRMFNSRWRYLGSCRSLAMFQRRDANVVSWVRMVGRLAYFGRNAVIKLGRKRGEVVPGSVEFERWSSASGAAVRQA
jgi:predicted O-methyltransferase YrrM